MLGTNERQRQTYVLHNGKPKALPDGVLMIVPTKFKPFVFSTLISPWGKLRMGMDLFIPPRRDAGDETLAEFVRRRLGSECLDKIAEPLMSGIYNAEADKQSLLATFPRFRELEAQHGSVTKGMLASQRARKAAAQAPTPAAPAQAGANGADGQAGSATQRRDRRPASRCRRSSHSRTASRNWSPYWFHGSPATCACTRPWRASNGTEPTTRCGWQTGSRSRRGPWCWRRRRLSAPTSCGRWRRTRPTCWNAIRYVSTGTISFGFRAAEAPNPLNGYGLVVPASAKRPINAITLSSVKFEQRAPEGYILLRAFFGGSRSPQSMELDDETLIATVRGELAQFLGIKAEPLFHRIYRWRRSNPQYDVGHLERVAGIEAALPPGLYVTGSAYRGVGIPDCIKQGQDTAGKMLGESTVGAQGPSGSVTQTPRRDLVPYDLGTLRAAGWAAALRFWRASASLQPSPSRTTATWNLAWTSCIMRRDTS